MRSQATVPQEGNPTNWDPSDPLQPHLGRPQSGATATVPLESATYIADLVPANPLTTDAVAQADDHLRLIKSVLQNQFPSLGDLQVSATAAQLNRAAISFLNSGTLEIGAPGTLSAVLKIDGRTGAGGVLLENIASGTPAELAIVMTDTANANPVTAMTLDYTGAMNVSGSIDAPVIAQNGRPIFPVDGIILWWGQISTIPAGWALCDGTNGTPDLRDRFVVGAGGSRGVGAVGAVSNTTANVNYEALAYIMFTG